MIDNLDKTVYQACGKLDELIKKYDELYTKQSEWNNKLNSDIINDYNLNNSNINGLLFDPNTGLTYNKNTDYQAAINAIRVLINNLRILMLSEIIRVIVLVRNMVIRLLVLVVKLILLILLKVRTLLPMLKLAKP